jgi:ATP phosphoribosyltransferase
LIKLALPKGRLQKSTAALLDRAGFGLSDYHEDSRSYRPGCEGLPQLLVKVFQERDVAIQVAVGNYDLGICGLEWVQELLIKYPSDAIVKVRELGYGRRNLYAVTSKFAAATSIKELQAQSDAVRLVGEYPNLAGSLALRLRLGRFKVFPVWGAAEVYPPESADIAIIPETSVAGLLDKGLAHLTTILTASAFLIAHKSSLEQKDLNPILSLLCNVDSEAEGEPSLPSPGINPGEPVYGDDVVSLALPDGHQQPHTMELLRKAGLKVQGYQLSLPTRRPSIELDGVATKVIRPQDMPLQVANGNFDLAISGRDWLWDHLFRFPSSPVAELLDLGFGRVQVVAVVSENVAADSADELRRLISSGQLSGLRLASEYVNIADKYARDNHLAPYQVLPTWGASEAFLPEDADVLIEVTETGETLAKHNLKIIDTLVQSSACLIGSKNPPIDPMKRERIAYIIEALRRAGGENEDCSTAGGC